MERERQKQYGLIRLDSDIVEDMERERRTFQLQMCEVCVGVRLFVGLVQKGVLRSCCPCGSGKFFSFCVWIRGNVALAALLNQLVIVIFYFFLKRGILFSWWFPSRHRPVDGFFLFFFVFWHMDTYHAVNSF